MTAAPGDLLLVDCDLLAAAYRSARGVVPEHVTPDQAARLAAYGLIHRVGGQWVSTAEGDRLARQLIEDHGGNIRDWH